MMSKKRVRVKPDISDNDRFGLTFLLTAIFHGIVILGITFTFTPFADSKTSPALDIILLKTQSPSKNKQADYLAQISQQGGGDSKKKARPRDRFSAPTLAQKSGQAMQTQRQQLKQPQQTRQIALLHQANASYRIYENDRHNTPDNKNQAEQSHISENLQAARLAAEVSDTIDEHAKTGKVKFLNSSTREFAPARYMRNWIDRVERVGNLNYPDQARRQKLNGTLILDVTISADGKLLKTDLRQSSGHQILDDAAKRIVKLAAPFAAFPEKLHQQADVIHITRSWEFLNSSGLHTH